MSEDRQPIQAFVTRGNANPNGGEVRERRRKKNKSVGSGQGAKEGGGRTGHHMRLPPTSRDPLAPATRGRGKGRYWRAAEENIPP